LSIMLALMVGVLRLLLGLLSLGAIVNMLSSPVIVGFTNAAALIIGLSQLSKVLGVPFPRTESYLADLWRVLLQVSDTHLPTLAFAIGTWLLIAGLRRYRPSLPGVLFAVIIATIASHYISFENKITVKSIQIADPVLLSKMIKLDNAQKRMEEITTELASRSRHADEMERDGDLTAVAGAAEVRSEIPALEFEQAEKKREMIRLGLELHHLKLRGVEQPDSETLYFAAGNTPEHAGQDKLWRFQGVSNGEVILSAGGDVVGDIPAGLPTFQAPVVQWDLILALLPAALVMALIGFMEATSISKAIATDTGERVSANKELIGQGLANIAGSFFSAFTVSGSFSRSAVAARSGAKTGLFAIISALAVVLVLLFFTKSLYDLPQAVLAVIVMMAVFSLIRIKPLVQAWKVDKVGALTGVITFVATLVMAPAIANGILIGVGLTILICLIRTMKPRADIVSRKPDGTLGGIQANNLTPISEHFVPVRFDGSLTFVNVAYFEDIILEALSDFPKAKAILVVGSAINEIDASGEEKVREVAERLQQRGVKLMFSGLKHQVRSLLERAGVVELLGREAFFPDKETALRSLCMTYGECTEGSTRQPRLNEAPS
ncbi:MAG: SulP family inorganic anion transporter, partial [Chromatiales bacterium]